MGWDYYPFGMLMPGRDSSVGNNYRYGFNGKERDDEVKGEGNQYDYGMRIYDSRTGRFYSVDPLFSSYAHYTPYQFSGNMPIMAIDLEGAEPEAVTDKAAEFIGTIYEWGGKNPAENWKAVNVKLNKNNDNKLLTYILVNISMMFKKTDDAQRKAIYTELNPGMDDAYKVKFSTGLSFGIDCSGLARLAFNSDKNKLMKNFDVINADAQREKFKAAQTEGKGIMHTDFNKVGQGDLVFDENAKGVVHHVMVATGNVRTNKKGDVTEVEVIHAPYSGQFVRKEFVSIKSTYSIGHSYRTGDVATPTAAGAQPDEDTQKNMQKNLDDFKEKYQHVQPKKK